MNDSLATALRVHTTSQLGPLLARLDNVSSDEEGRALVATLERSAQLADREDMLVAVRARDDYRRWTANECSANDALSQAIDQDNAPGVRAALAQRSEPLSVSERTHYAIKALNSESVDAFRVLVDHGKEPLDVCGDDFAFIRALCASSDADCSMVTHCLELLAVSARSDDSPISVNDALNLVNELQTDALKSQNYVAANELNTCAGVLLGILDAKMAPTQEPVARSSVATRKKVVSAAPKKIIARTRDTTDNFSYKNRGYKIAVAYHRAGVRRVHVEALVDRFTRSKNASLTYTELKKAFDAELRTRRVAYPLSSRVAGAAVRIAFGDDVVSRSGGTRYELEHLS